MRTAIARFASVLAICLAVAASALAAHYASASVEDSSWGAALAILPFAAAAAAFCWQSSHRVPLLVLFACAVAVVLAIWPRLAAHVEWLYLTQHVSINGLLALGFGATLRGGREPLCTQVARLIRGKLDCASLRYTRGVTLAWTLFFATMTGASLTLFAFAPIAVWSSFANLLTWPLVGAMFIAEYGARRMLLPQDRSSILDAIRAYRRSADDSVGASTAAPTE